MELLPEFVVRHAETPQEAARLLAGDAGARILGGGTGLVANMRLGLDAPCCGWGAVSRFPA
jgi:CO/xanthine dehydrogenase FAD-binding subunit